MKVDKWIVNTSHMTKIGRLGVVGLKDSKLCFFVCLGLMCGLIGVISILPPCVSWG